MFVRRVDHNIILNIDTCCLRFHPFILHPSVFELIRRAVFSIHSFSIILQCQLSLCFYEYFGLSKKPASAKPRCNYFCSKAKFKLNIHTRYTTHKHLPWSRSCSLALLKKASLISRNIHKNIHLSCHTRWSYSNSFHYHYQ